MFFVVESFELLVFMVVILWDNCDFVGVVGSFRFFVILVIFFILIY